VTAGKLKTIDSFAPPVLLDAGYADLGDGVYKAIRSSREVEHFIYIYRDLKREYMLSGKIGIRNEDAEVFSCNSIRSYGGELFQLFKCGEPTTCAMRFSFDQLDGSGWPLHLTNFTAEQLSSFLEDFLARRVVPTIGHINNLDEFLEFLAADKPYFPWPGSNGAIRAAQVVAVAGQIGLKVEFVRAMLEPRKRLIAAGLSNTSEMKANPVAYIDRILEDWTAFARKPI
jgi:hypothetical protein